MQNPEFSMGYLRARFAITKERKNSHLFQLEIFAELSPLGTI